MPRATKKINVNNGKDASAPLNPKTFSKTNWHTPSVAINESTTVNRRSAAAKMLRNKSPRIIPIIISTTGIITLLS